jgi:hypothetical protein
MKILKRIIIGVLVVIAILVIVAYLLPATYSVERSIKINSNDSTVFNMVCDLKNWELWSGRLAKVDYEYIGGCEVGAVQRWVGRENMRSGEMILTEMVPMKMLKLELKYEGVSEQMNFEMTFKKEGEDMLVTWTVNGELGNNPQKRYFGKGIESVWGPELEKELRNLKNACEKLPG